MELKTGLEKGILNAVFTGSYTLEEAKRTFLSLIEEVKKHRASKVLVDGRTVTGKPTTMERFYYGEFCAAEVLKLVNKHSLIPKFAFILQEPVLDPGRFGENVAVNRGMNVKMFDNIDEAQAWLDEAR